MALVAEAVVIAHHEFFHAIALAEETAHEVACRKLRHLHREIEHHAGVDAALRQMAVFLFGRVEQHGTIVGLQHLARMALEGDGHARHVVFTRQPLHLREKIAVAGVDTIEETDGGHTLGGSTNGGESLTVV